MEISVLKRQRLQLIKRNGVVIFYVITVGESDPVHLLVGEQEAGKSFLQLMVRTFPSRVIFKSELNTVVVECIGNIIIL